MLTHECKGNASYKHLSIKQENIDLYYKNKPRIFATVPFRINRHWSVDGNYSYLHMKEPVVAAPGHKLYAGTNFSHGRWNLSTGMQYIAGLYTQTDPVTTENFVLWNLRVSFQATRWLDLWARGENLLAQRYEINAGYPMPRATIMAGISLNLLRYFR